MRSKNTQIGGYPRGIALIALTLAAAIPCDLPAAAQAPGSPAGASARSERKVKLDFVGADVAVVAKALSIQSGENVVLMPSVSGKVTVRLTDLTLEEALRKVAVAVGADVRKVDNSYFIGSTTELRAMMTKSGIKETWSPKFVTASDAKELLQHSFPYLTVEQVGKSNILVLAGSEEDVRAAIGKARLMDVPPPPVAKEDPPSPLAPVRIKDAYYVKHARPEALADALEKAMPELTVTRVDKSLVLEGTAQHQQQAAKLLAALDVQGVAQRVVRAYKLKYLHPHQASFVLKPIFPNLTISAGFESYTPSKVQFDPLTIGAQKGFQAGGSSGSGGSGGGQSSSQSSSGGGGGQGGGPQDITGPGMRSRTVILAGAMEEVEQATQILEAEDVRPQQVAIEARVVDMTPENSKQLGLLYDWSPLEFVEKNDSGVTPILGVAGTFAGSFLRSPFSFLQTLEAMETKKQAKILAKPNIAVIDGEEAQIFIGDILRFERLQSVSDSGQQQFTIEDVPVGVVLLVRPRVNEEGKITLKVHPTVSTLKELTGERRDIPVTSSREAQTTVMMNDGDTFAIGGLLREEELKILTKVPLLGDIPFLGELFRHRNNRKSKSEVTIFLTARIIKEGA
jgi:type II secretory pathway component GspD/PulD (secretin)